MKYGFPVRFLNDSQTAYIRGNLINSGVLYVFWDTKTWSPDVGCQGWDCAAIEEENKVYCDGIHCHLWFDGSKGLYEGVDRLSSWSNTRHNYYFFVYFMASSGILCPPVWGAGISESSQCRITGTSTWTHPFRNNYQEFDITCDLPPGCPVTFKSAGSWHVGAPYIYTGSEQKELFFKKPTSEEEVYAVWLAISQGKAAFPLQGVKEEYFYSYGTLGKGPMGQAPCQREAGNVIGGIGVCFSPGVYNQVASRLVLQSYLATYELDTVDIHVEIDTGDGSGWTDTTIWSGNSIGQPIFNSDYYEAHVIERDWMGG